MTTGAIRYRVEFRGNLAPLESSDETDPMCDGYDCLGTFPKNICLARPFTPFSPCQNSLAQRSGFPSGLTFMTPKTVPSAHRIAIIFPDVSSIAQPGSGRSDAELKRMGLTTLTLRSWRGLPSGVCATSGLCVDSGEVTHDVGE
jgi:hypothetical protein